MKRFFLHFISVLVVVTGIPVTGFVISVPVAAAEPTGPKAIVDVRYDDFDQTRGGRAEVVFDGGWSIGATAAGANIRQLRVMLSQDVVGYDRDFTISLAKYSDSTCNNLQGVTTTNWASQNPAGSLFDTFNQDALKNSGYESTPIDASFSKYQCVKIKVDTTPLPSAGMKFSQVWVAGIQSSLRSSAYDCRVYYTNTAGVVAPNWQTEAGSVPYYKGGNSDGRCVRLFIASSLSGGTTGVLDDTFELSCRIVSQNPLSITRGSTAYVDIEAGVTPDTALDLDVNLADNLETGLSATAGKMTKNGTSYRYSSLVRSDKIGSYSIGYKIAGNGVVRECSKITVVVADAIPVIDTGQLDISCVVSTGASSRLAFGQSTTVTLTGTPSGAYDKDVQVSTSVNKTGITAAGGKISLQNGKYTFASDVVANDTAFGTHTITYTVSGEGLSPRTCSVDVLVYSAKLVITDPVKFSMQGDGYEIDPVLGIVRPDDNFLVTAVCEGVSDLQVTTTTSDIKVYIDAADVTRKGVNFSGYSSQTNQAKQGSVGLRCGESAALFYKVHKSASYANEPGDTTNNLRLVVVPGSWSFADSTIAQGSSAQGSMIVYLPAFVDMLINGSSGPVSVESGSTLNARFSSLYVAKSSCEYSLGENKNPFVSAVQSQVSDNTTSDLPIASQLNRTTQNQSWKYFQTCKNARGESISSPKITVEVKPGAQSELSVSLTCDTNNFITGLCTTPWVSSARTGLARTLKWVSTGAGSCDLKNLTSGQVYPNRAPNELNFDTGNIPTETDFSLTCYPSSNLNPKPNPVTTTAKIKLMKGWFEVIDPKNGNWTQNPIHVKQNDPVTLRWGSENSTNCSFNQVGVVPQDSPGENLTTRVFSQVTAGTYISFSCRPTNTLSENYFLLQSLAIVVDPNVNVYDPKYSPQSITAGNTCTSVRVVFSKPSATDLVPVDFQVYRNTSGFSNPYSGDLVEGSVAFDSIPASEQQYTREYFVGSNLANTKEVQTNQRYYFGVRAHYTIAGADFYSQTVPAQSDISVKQCSSDFNDNDKDIIAVNANPLLSDSGQKLWEPNADFHYLYCNGKSDGTKFGVNSSFPDKAMLTFRVCIKNSGEVSSVGKISLHDVSENLVVDYSSFRTTSSTCKPTTDGVTRVSDSEFSFTFTEPTKFKQNDVCLLIFNARLQKPLKTISQCYFFNNTVDVFDGATQIGQPLDIQNINSVGRKTKKQVCISNKQTQKFEISP